MKVSINLAQRYSNVDLKSIDRSVLLQKIGAQLGAVEEVIDWAPKYEGIVVVKVVACENHSNADKLHVCRVDDGGVTEGVERGEDGLVQVVCGAPNVHTGMFVAWIPPGRTVPSSLDTSDPFVLEAREIRGVVSNGMLASAKELAISDNHDGILEITPEEAKHEPSPGELLVGLFGLDDFIVTCENKMFTHRPDCFGNLGVARELAGINGLKFESPDWYLTSINSQLPMVDVPLPFSSKNEITGLVPRFMAQVIEGITVKPSRIGMQAGLTRVGMKPINNIVDFSNYYMHLTAQPTHAFDYDKIKALSSGEPIIFPRMAEEGEELTLLGGKTIKLSGDDIVIATDQKAIALAGVMGGAETEVDENTKNIIIECATFDMYAIRRSSMRHGIFTEAVTRFNKGQSPLQNDRILAKLVNDIVEQTGAKAGAIFDSVSENNLIIQNEVSVSVDFINTRLGSNLTSEDIQQLLQNVEFVTLTSDPQSLIAIKPPFWRMDIELSEDIVEEIGRLYSYDRLPVELPKRVIKPANRNKLLEFKDSLRQSLAKTGANELLTYSFVHGDLIKNSGTNPEEWAIHIRNAISPDLQYYRTSLIPSLLAKVHSNIKSDLVRSEDNEFAIFEIGKAHVKNHLDNEQLPAEFERLVFVFAADDKTAARKYYGSPMYQAKHYLLSVLPLGANYTFEMLEGDTAKYPITASYQAGRSAIIKVNDEIFGVVGEFRSSVKKSLKLPEFCSGFELDTGIMHQHATLKRYQPLPAFPKTQQDITFEVNESVKFSDLIQLTREELENIRQNGYVSSLRPQSIFQGEDKSKKRVTYRIWLSHYEKTLVTDEVNKILTKIGEVAHEKLGAVRI